jgi:hypothetical protein
MSKVFDKLNLKNQNKIIVINAPASFEPELAALRGVSVLRSLQDVDETEFSLAFGTKQSEVDTFGKAIAKKAKGDAVVWFAYPKGSSKKYKCEFNPDNRWQAFGKAGFEPVRMVAIDEDWSAVRFRRAEYIKTLTRDKQYAMSKQGKARAADKRG